MPFFPNKSDWFWVCAYNKICKFKKYLISRVCDFLLYFQLQVDLTVWILELTLWYLINYPWPWPCCSPVPCITLLVLSNEESLKACRLLAHLDTLTLSMTVILAGPSEDLHFECRNDSSVTVHYDSGSGRTVHSTIQLRSVTMINWLRQIVALF